MACEWQEKLFPRMQKRILDDDGMPTNQTECIPPTLPEICLDLRASYSGASDPWPDDFLAEVVEMLQSRVDTWESRKGDDPIDRAVLQMVSEAIRIGRAELRDRKIRDLIGRVKYTSDCEELDALLSRIRECDGKYSDCLVLGWDQCQMLVKALDARLSGERDAT